MTQDHVAIFRRRLEEELQRVQNCADPFIAAIHQRMADQCEQALAPADRPAAAAAGA